MNDQAHSWMWWRKRPWWQNFLYGFVIGTILVGATMIYNAKADRIDSEPSADIVGSQNWPEGFAHWCEDFGPQRRAHCDRLLDASRPVARNLREREAAQPDGQEWDNLTANQKTERRRDYKEAWLKRYGGGTTIVAADINWPSCGDSYVPCLSDLIGDYACMVSGPFVNPMQVVDCVNRWPDMENEERLIVACEAATVLGFVRGGPLGMAGTAIPCLTIWYNWQAAKNGEQFN